MIVVIDSGVWISALHFGGIPQLAVYKVLTTATVAVCDQVRQEIERVLVEKMEWEPRRVAASLSFYFRDAIWVPITGSLQGICRDPKDDMIVECAVGAGAELIISGDKDLLAVGRYGRIHILTARQYISQR